MFENLKNRRIRPVTGIAGYQVFTKRYGEFCFKTQLPSNWVIDQYPLVEREGIWIALRGPVNQSKTINTTLHITLSEREANSQIRSLDEYMKNSIKQTSIGEPTVLLNQEVIVGGISGREAKITYKWHRPYAGKLLEIIMVKQWFIIFKEDYILEVSYGSTEETFDAYYEAYQKVVDTLTFQP
ncbi:MAG: hypothetical protein ACOYYS_08500 [Chloroflexota bacterium]